MSNKTYKNYFWTEAATGGLILGAGMFLLSFLSYRFRLAPDYSGMMSLIQVAFTAVIMIVFGRRVAAYREDGSGFSYGQSMGFILAMMLFTGIIYGTGEYVLQVRIDPQYFDQLYNDALRDSKANPEFVEKMINIRQEMSEFIKNPIIMVISGVISMLFYGGIVGLIASVFIKKKADGNIS